MSTPYKNLINKLRDDVAAKRQEPSVKPPTGADPAVAIKWEEDIAAWKCNIVTLRLFDLLQEDCSKLADEIISSAPSLTPEHFPSLHAKLVKLHTLREQLNKKGTEHIWTKS